jgi:hypothetical protein
MVGVTRELLTLLWRNDANMRGSTCQVPMEGYRDNHRPEGGSHWGGCGGHLARCQGLQMDRDE